VTGARRVEVTPGEAGRWQVDADRETDEGFDRVEVMLPLVLTAAERLIAPIRTDPDALQHVSAGSIETWVPADLGLPPDQVGDAGSPTTVLELREQRTERPPAVVHTGDVDQQARALAECITRWQARSGAADRRRPLPATAPPADERRSVWVVAERRSDGAPTATTLELLGEAAWLARQLGGFAAAVVTEPQWADASVLGEAGADRIMMLDWRLASGGSGAAQPSVPPYAPELHGAAIAALLRQRPSPFAVLFSASEYGREVAPRVAARCGLGLTGDCIGLALEAEERLLQLKPALGTQVVAPIWSRTTPQLASVRPGTFPPPRPVAGRSATIERIALTIDVARWSALTERVVEVDPGWRRIEAADAIVGVGTGIGGPEALPLIRRFADLFGAAIGATRRVTDRGWLPRALQIGLTGRIVAPDLYVAVGVRGAPNHTIGITGARTIAALNNDPGADIFADADLGFVGDFRPLLERTCALLEQRDR
jgi:electron transfer flavoprotein alpha subunit